MSARLDMLNCELHFHMIKLGMRGHGPAVFYLGWANMDQV